MTLTRRQVLTGAAAGSASVAAATLAATPSGRAAARLLNRAMAIGPRGQSLEAIEHIVILIQENRSFDHYFGSYTQGVRGFEDPAVLRQPGGLPVFAQPGYADGRSPNGYLLPFHLNTQTEDAFCTPDIDHQWPTQHKSWNNGAMNNFFGARLITQGQTVGPGTMGYYTRADIPFYYALADAFTLLDGYHCSVMGPTDPNRCMSVSAWIDPAGVQGGPVLNTSTPSAPYKWKTMMEALEDAAVDWKIYQSSGAPNVQQGAGPFNEEFNNIVAFFEAFQDSKSDLYKRAFTPEFPGDLADDVKNDTLPSVSWVLFEGVQDESEHPSSPPEWGEAGTAQLLSVLTSNPDVWAKTLLIHTYDENGGWFDHVAPPVPPAGTAGEFVTASPLPASAGGIAGPIGLGFRVPCLLISPFTRGGWIGSDTFDHTSLLRLIETRFGVTVPNLSDWRRSVTGDLTSAIGVDAPPDTSVPSLPSVSLNNATVNRECDVSPADPTYSVTAAPYVVPEPQTWPTQEPGTVQRRGGQPTEPGSTSAVQYYRRLQVAVAPVKSHARSVRVTAQTLSGDVSATIELWHGPKRLTHSPAHTLTTSPTRVTLYPPKALAPGKGYRVVLRVGGTLVLTHPVSVA